jgi:hypothetical protein
MQSNYRSTIQREVSAFEFVLELRDKCVREESLVEEFLQIKCKDCVEEEGWGYAKMAYFEGWKMRQRGRWIIMSKRKLSRRGMSALEETYWVMRALI